MKILRTWFATRTDWRTLFAIVAFGYGVFAVYQIAAAPIPEGATKRPRLPEDIWHVMLWTFVPPLWFYFETMVIAKTPEEREKIKPHQDLVSKVWAAVLAAILFLVPK